jgi:hypothetical protein
MLFQVNHYLHTSNSKAWFSLLLENTVWIMHQHTLLPEYSLYVIKKIWHF